MPAAAVTPAPIAYIKVVVVKKLVVGSQPNVGWSAVCAVATAPTGHFTESSGGASNRVSSVVGTFTLKKLECSKQTSRLNTVAWNNEIGLWFYFVGLRNQGND